MVVGLEDMPDNLPPTDEVIQMRKPFIVSLGFLCFVIISKFIIFDYWGAFIMIFLVMMGVLVLEPHGINVPNAWLFTFMCMLSGVFDILGCVLYFQHSKYTLYESKAPGIVLFAQTVFIVTPIAEFIAGAISYRMFASMRDFHFGTMGGSFAEQGVGGYAGHGPYGGHGGGGGPTYGGGGGHYGGVGRGGGSGTFAGSGQTPGGGNANRQPQFQSFAGRGQTLG